MSTPSGDTASPEAPQEPSVGRAFWLGLTRPSAASLLGAWLVAAGLLVAAAVWVTPATIGRVDAQRLMLDPDDVNVLVTARCLRAREAPAPAASVVLLGASGLREATDPATVAAGLASAASATSGPELLDLCGSAMRLGDFLAAAECVAGRRGVLVLGIGPSRIATPAVEGWLPVDSPGVEALRRRAGLAPRTGTYLLDHGAFWVARAPGLLRAPRPVQRHRYRGMAQKDRTALLRDARRLVPPGAYRANMPHAFATIDRIHALCGEGLALVLLETPRHPLLIEAMGAADWRLHRATMRRYAEERRVRYWDLQDDAGLTPDAFYDLLHLGSAEATARFSRRLGERVAALLAERR